MDPFWMTDSLTGGEQFSTVAEVIAILARGNLVPQLDRRHSRCGSIDLSGMPCIMEQCIRLGLHAWDSFLLFGLPSFVLDLV